MTLHVSGFSHDLGIGAAASDMRIGDAKHHDANAAGIIRNSGGIFGRDLEGVEMTAVVQPVGASIQFLVDPIENLLIFRVPGPS